jgi:hypothetical protein
VVAGLFFSQFTNNNTTMHKIHTRKKMKKTDERNHRQREE